MPELIDRESFQSQLSTTQIIVSPQFPDSNHLVHSTVDQDSRFWVKPEEAGTWPQFLGTILDGLDPWDFADLAPQSGQWPRSDHSKAECELVRDVILRGAGVPPGWDGAIRFKKEERSVLLAIMFVELAFGWCSDDDMFFIPDHGRQIIKIDHHDVVHLSCKDQSRMMTMVRYMESAGYTLPSELPDATFKWPHWMSREE